MPTDQPIKNGPKGKVGTFLLFTAVVLSLAYYLGVHTSFAGRSAAHQWVYTLGVTFLVPAAYYFLVIRPYRLSIISLLFVFLLSVAFGELVVPDQHKKVFRYISYFLLFTEGLLIVLVGLKLAKIGRSLRRVFAEGKEYGFLNKFRKGVEAVLGPFHDNFLLTETAVFYYLMVAPFRGHEVPADGTGFTMHREGHFTYLFVCRLTGLLTGLSVLVIGLLQVAGLIPAVIIAGLGLYGAIYLCADYFAMVRRPIMIRDNILYCYIGMRWTGEYPATAIERVEKLQPGAETKGALDASLNKKRDVRIYFRKEQVIRTLFGIRKKCRSLILTVDDPEGFIQKLPVRHQAAAVGPAVPRRAGLLSL